MKSLRKITAWAMALAIASTAAAMTTAYAEGEEAPTEVLTEAPTDAPTALPTEAPTEAVTDAPAPTEAPTEAPTQLITTGDVSGIIQGLEIRVTGNNIYIKDTATGTSVNVENGKATVDGKVIDEINLELDVNSITEEEQRILMRAAEVMNDIAVSEIVFTDNVAEINVAVFDASEVDGCTKITFGKNIKAINADPLGNSSAAPVVYGYSGTAAETYAKNKSLTFSSIGQVASTTAAATTAKKTTTVKTTAKAVTTTSKKSESPKTGDAGTVTGVLAIAAAAGILSMKKKKHE